MFVLRSAELWLNLAPSHMVIRRLFIYLSSISINCDFYSIHFISYYGFELATSLALIVAGTFACVLQPHHLKNVSNVKCIPEFENPENITTLIVLDDIIIIISTCLSWSKVTL